MKTHLFSITTTIILLLLNFSLYAQNSDITTLINKANTGDASAQNELGICYAKGKGVTEDLNEAIKWYRKAAEQGHAEAQNKVGNYYFDGKGGLPQDYVEAVKWYRKAAVQGNNDAIHSLAKCYYEGNGVNKSYEEAIKIICLSVEKGNNFKLSVIDSNGGDINRKQYLLATINKQIYNDCYSNDIKFLPFSTLYDGNFEYIQLSAKNCNRYAQYILCLIYYFGDFEFRDYKEAIQYFRLASEKGIDNLQFFLGICYYYGNGVNQDYKEATKYFRILSEKRVPSAQYFLGICYYYGSGVTKNYNEVIKYFRLAAEQNYAPAQHNLGICYYYGIGVVKNYNEAVKYFRLAAEQNYASAQCFLGICYYYDNDMIKNYEEAAKYFRLAAEQNYASAQYNLGVCYYYGNGVIKNYKEATEWLLKSTKTLFFQPRKNDCSCVINQNYKSAIYFIQKYAEGGDKDAQFILSLCYNRGIGVENDYKKSVIWLQLAAKQNHVEAKKILDICLNYKNDEFNLELTSWYELALELQNESAKYMEGVFSFLDQEYGKAVKSFLFAAEKGNKNAQYYLGDCYYHGYGVDQNYVEAVNWYRKAAVQGLASAQHDLGVCYYNGKGTIRNIAEAKKLWEQVLKSDDSTAIKAAKNNLEILKTGTGNIKIIDNFNITTDFNRIFNN